MSSSSSKKGQSKPKGSVRAKSGCYTCRIRRKVRVPCMSFKNRSLTYVLSRNAMNSPTKRATARLVSVCDSSAWVLAPKGLNGCGFVFFVFFCSFQLPIPVLAALRYLSHASMTAVVHRISTLIALVICSVIRLPLQLMHALTPLLDRRVTMLRRCAKRSKAFSHPTG